MRKVIRRIKWIVGSLLVVVIALLVAGYVVIANYPVEELKALIQDETRKATGRELVIEGGAEMEVSFSPSIVLEEVHLRNASWASSEDMVTLGRFEIEVELWPLINGDIVIKRLVLVDALVDLERNEDGVGNWEIDSTASAGESDGSSSLPSFSRVSIENARVSLVDRQADLSKTVVLSSLEASGDDREDAISVTAQGSVDDLPFDLAIALPDIAGMVAGGAFPTKIEGTVDNAKLRLEGQVGPPETAGNDFHFWLEGEDLARIGTPFGLGLMPDGPYKLEALVRQTGSTGFALPLVQGTLGGSDFKSTLVVGLHDSETRVNGDFHATRFVVPQGEPGEPADGGGDGLFPSDPLPLDGLKALNATIALNFGEVVIGERTLKDVTASLSLESGVLKLAPLSFGYRNGSVEGSLELDAAQSPPALTVQMQGRGLSLEEATGGALTGSLAVDLDLRASGASPEAMAASLTGQSALSSDNGVIDNRLLAVVSAPLANALGPLIGGDGKVAVTCLVNRFSWNGGIGTNQGTALDTATFSVIGNGTVDLRSETIDFYVDTWTKDSALVGLAVPLTITGPLSAPSIAPDPAGTALGLAKTAGLIVFPPAGLSAIINDREAAQGENPCVAAVEEVEEQGGPETFFEALGGSASGSVEGLIDNVGQGASDAVEGIGKGAQDAIEGVKGLFGN